MWAQKKQTDVTDGNEAQQPKPSSRFLAKSVLKFARLLTSSLRITAWT